jgi:16S rRNA (guanine527-N7)-methyltransferase
MDALERARRLGVLGPGPVDQHVGHAQGFVEALAGVAAGSLVVDLGSGGGVPGLIVAEARPDLRMVLLDAMEKRTALLSEAVAAMGMADRITVRTGRAEVLGREDDLRGAAMAVTARSFGPPAATAECAAPLLAVGGVLVVSEPPDSPDRWPAGPLATLGLSSSHHEVPGMQVLVQTDPCPTTYPRRTGLPTKRPLF